MLTVRPSMFVEGKAVEGVREVPLPRRAKVWLVEGKVVENAERVPSVCS